MHTTSQTEKDRITPLISHELNNDELVIFAYIYGSIEKFLSDIKT